MSCPHQYYEDENSYYPMLYCRVKGTPCLYRKRCDLQQKYISIDGADNCYILMEEKRKVIPNGAYYIKTRQVLPNECLRLFVEMGNNTIMYTTDFKEVNQDYVYVKDNKVSLTPFKEEIVEKKLKQTKGKKKTEE